MRITRAGGLARLRGLAFSDPTADALHIPHCRSVHTFGMRYPLDLVWLDGGGAVVRIDRSVPPGRVRCCRAARSVVEMRAGGADAVAVMRSPAAG
jgi:uncharacterized membrane protein (UPF0127 family)